jgi:enoyl-CoA hydratase/carnithine racemase
MPQIAAKLSEYGPNYRNIDFARGDDGVLEMTLHTKGSSLVWSARAHEELGYCFTQVGADRENAVILLTGAGDDFCVDIDMSEFDLDTPTKWDLDTFYDGRRLLMNLLDIDVPIVAVVNGPATIHPEIAILSDIVIASDTAVFQDSPHYVSGLVPGDGAHVAWTHVLGPNRGRYFLLTGQKLDAQQALDMGAVNEVLPKERALERGRELAKAIASQPFLTRRYTRMVLAQRIKKIMLEELGFGLALEGLAALDVNPLADEGVAG